MISELISAVIIFVLLMCVIPDAHEQYRSCRDPLPCAQPKMIGAIKKTDNTLLINPFMWPYSGIQCLAPESSPSSPLTHASVPDHVELV